MRLERGDGISLGVGAVLQRTDKLGHLLTEADRIVPQSVEHLHCGRQPFLRVHLPRPRGRGCLCELALRPLPLLQQARLEEVDLLLCNVVLCVQVTKVRVQTSGLLLVVIADPLDLRAAVRPQHGSAFHEILLYVSEPRSFYPDHLLHALIDTLEGLVALRGELADAGVDRSILRCHVCLRSREARVSAVLELPDLVQGVLLQLGFGGGEPLIGPFQARLQVISERLQLRVDASHLLVDRLLQLVVPRHAL
mmetsp:Transcript_94756/g.203577  ORF Transcript_94756/g.203577 Transcript_94756/m.203577 type:complete len:251 (-) Transcript_94756:1140-1892(-)